VSEKQPTDETLPGIPFEHFEAAVKALWQLRRDGKFLLFLSRTNNIRFIGDPESYREALATKVKRESPQINDEQLVLEEVRDVLQTCVTFGEAAQAAHFLEQSVYDNLFKKLGPEQKTKARELLQKKTELVFSDLFKGSLAQRAERLDTAVSACIEDLDVEVVSERQDELRGEHILAPFLRLRLRYADGGGENQYPWLLLRRGNFGGGNVKTFEIECDETDIDLLLRRLLAAKERLLRITSEEQSEEPQV
jgi:hypothetical protein